jgi:hypothetical protein
MGTWAVQRDKIPDLIGKLDALKKEAYSVAGDDQFFDCIDSGIKRLKDMASREWRGCGEPENPGPLAEAGVDDLEN